MTNNTYYQLQIIQIITETKDAKTFVLQPLNNWLPVYKAGQFLTLVFDTKYGEKRRSYSISSSPELNEPLSITIKKVENGEFSRLLLTHSKVGDILSTSGISGLFQLPENTDADQFFFLAAGSGITPCFSLIKILLHSTNKNVVLVYSNRSEEETIFHQQLLLLQKQFPERLIIRFLFSSRGLLRNRLSNWLLQQLLKEYLPEDSAKTLFYLCGPFEYMQTATITLLSEGIPSHNIKKENFSSLPRKTKPIPPDTAAHLVTVHFQDQVHQLTVQYPNSILAVAKASHIPLPYSCEAGRCGSCAATCIKGKVWMAYNEVLLDDEIAAGRILCCQAYPINGDISIVFLD
jgi:ferredoxin-NADP reductase